MARRRALIAAGVLAAALSVAVPFAWDAVGQHVALSASCDGAPSRTATCVMYPSDPADDLLMFRRMPPGHVFETTFGGPGARGATRTAFCMDDAKQAAMRMRSTRPAIAATLDLCDATRTTTDAEDAHRLSMDEIATLQARRASSRR